MVAVSHLDEKKKTLHEPGYVRRTNLNQMQHFLHRWFTLEVDHVTLS